MYMELIGEMAKHGLTRKQIAKEIGVSEKTFSNKINGKTDFTWNEVKKIRNIVNPSANLEQLFEKTLKN